MRQKFTKHFLIASLLVLALQASRAQGPYIIPVVFHVLHLNGPENIPDSTINMALKLLNDDFHGRNADTADVIIPFKPLIADAGIQFQLAAIDPEGSATNGIDRIYTTATDSGHMFSGMINQWNPHHYLNIWTFAKIPLQTDLDYRPDIGYPAHADSFPAHDGIEELSDGLLSYHQLTHAAGHYLNLMHTWGISNNPGGECGDDSVSDTPLTKGWVSCPSQIGSEACAPGVPENYQNFMEYSYCSHMFTPGQKDRMITCLNNRFAYRDSLWLRSNLEATGIIPATGIEENSLQGISIYPNPVSAAVEIRGLRQGVYDIEVCNLLGQSILSIPQLIIQADENAGIDLSALKAKEVYLLKISDGNKTETIKVIKE